MCGRYALTYEDQRELEDFLNALDKGIYRRDGTQSEAYFANYNAAPTSVMPVCHVNDEGERVIESMYWWFMKWLPKNGKPDFKYSTFNTRDDKLLSSRLWGKDFQEKQIRCIIPMNCFYEFSGVKGKKTAHLFKPKEERFWGAAGIYSPISPNENMGSFSIITTEANCIVDGVHDRMPAFLHPSEFDDWLNPNHTADFLIDMLKPYPEDAMETYIASPEVSNARNNYPELLNRSTLF